MSLQAMSAAILIAASSNSVLKAVYALAFGGVRLCRRPAGELLILGLAGFVAAAIYMDDIDALKTSMQSIAFLRLHSRRKRRSSQWRSGNTGAGCNLR
jgi:hypothetical protein